MQSASGQTTTVVQVSPKSHAILQQNGQHVLLGKLSTESASGRTTTSGSDANLLQTAHTNNTQTIYPAHYIEAIAEQTVYAANGDGGGIIEIKSGTPLRKLFASVTKTLPGQYQEYTPIIYAPVSGGQTYYQTASGQVLATAFGAATGTGHGATLHPATHANLTTGHAQLVTHQGATYLVQGSQLDDDTSAISHTAKASPVTVQWLVDNYETAEGVSLPRSTLYFHYLQHCNEHKLEPMNPASFGKLIRSVFYGLRTRRLGTRGNSKYHYYGIRIKPNSPLNHFVEDANFSLRHYPNYHRQTMEAAAEWKNFTNSSNNSSLSSTSTSINRLKSSLSSNLSNLNNIGHLNNVHHTNLHHTVNANTTTTNANNNSTNLSTNTSQQSHYESNINSRTEKSFTNTSTSSSYNVNNSNANISSSNIDNISSSLSTSTTSTTISTLTTTTNNTTLTTNSNLLSNANLSQIGQHQHAQFLGEASSALPNLDEICRSSGLPVPSEVDLSSLSCENPTIKSRAKMCSSSSDSLFCSDVITFCRLYALSAGYMLDAVVNLDFTAIETVWKAFWCTEEVRDSRLKQSLSQERLYALVSDPAVLQFVRLYDHTFYQSLAEVLIPNVLRPIPPTLTQAIRNFAKSLEGWMRQATQGLDSTLINLKVSAVSALAQTLRRYTSLNHLAQAARAVLKNSNQINQMLTDLNRVDFNNVQEQASWVCQCSDGTVTQLEQDFKRILHKHASLEEWAQWLDTVVTSILQPLEGNSLAYTRAAHQLILKWSFYSSMVIRDLTLRSAASFGSFHLIRLLYDEYIFYLIEHKVAAHLGMTPVAVMGEMGRDLTQQTYTSTRLHSDLVGRREMKSFCSRESHDFNSSEYSEPDDSSSYILNNQESRTRLENRVDQITEEDEEVDEYLDDEEDVDDSVGDESTMLKEAHASVQAFCRSSGTSVKVSDGANNVCDQKKGETEDILNENDKNDLDLKPPENEKQTDLVTDSLSEKSQFTEIQDKCDNISLTEPSVGDEGEGTVSSCSPPSIVTLPNPVRKVVRVTTFCDTNQQNSEASFTNCSSSSSSPTSSTRSANTKLLSSVISSDGALVENNSLNESNFVVSTVHTNVTNITTSLSNITKLANPDSTAAKRPKLN